MRTQNIPPEDDSLAISQLWDIKSDIEKRLSLLENLVNSSKTTRQLSELVAKLYQMDLDNRLRNLLALVMRSYGTMSLSKWRIKESGNNLIFEYYNGSAWDTKQTIYSDGSGVIQSAFLWSDW